MSSLIETLNQAHKIELRQGAFSSGYKILADDTLVGFVEKDQRSRCVDYNIYDKGDDQRVLRARKFYDTPDSLEVTEVVECALTQGESVSNLDTKMSPLLRMERVFLKECGYVVRSHRRDLTEEGGYSTDFSSVTITGSDDTEDGYTTYPGAFVSDSEETCHHIVSSNGASSFRRKLTLVSDESCHCQSQVSMVEAMMSAFFLDVNTAEREMDNSDIHHIWSE